MDRGRWSNPKQMEGDGMILAIDTALKKCGYAVGEKPGAILERGILWSDDKREFAEDRAISMVDDMDALIRQYRVKRIIMEMPAPQAPVMHYRNKRTGRQEQFMPRGQAEYGVACGTIKNELRHRFPAIPIRRARSDEWSMRTKKAAHIAAAKLLDRGYESNQDPDGDAADAVCLLALESDPEAFRAALLTGKAQAKRTVNARKIVGGIFTGVGA